jgi:hypothetical protein
MTAVPAIASVISVNCSPVALVNAITAANSSPGIDTLDLAPECAYTLTGADNVLSGANGLPAIASEIVINGNGATIARSPVPETPPFRLFYVGADTADPDTLNFPSPGAGDLTLRDLTLSNGLASGGNYPGTGGGAILSEGEVTLERTTVRGSAAQGGQVAVGGGILNSHGELYLRNATISGNTAQGTTSGLGGGVANVNGLVDADSATIAFNTASTQGHSLYNLGYDGATARAAQASLRNTILSDGTGAGAVLSSDAPEQVAGEIPNLATSSVDVSQFDIVESQVTGGNGTITGSPVMVDPGLSPLAVNVSSSPAPPPFDPPPTHAITDTSPAFDQGSTSLAQDQRQVTRPQGGADDIGAFELVAPEPEVPRTLTLRNALKTQKFNGNLESSTPDCVDTMTVSIFKKLKGDDKLIGDTQTNANGKYKLAKKAKKGKYYSSVAVDVVPGVAECLAAESPTLRVK